MTRINAIRNAAHSVSWGKATETKTIATAALGNLNAYIFAAVLIVCSVAVGCSSEKPKPVSSNQQIPVAQPTIPAPDARSCPASGEQACSEKDCSQAARDRELRRQEFRRDV